MPEDLEIEGGEETFDVIVKYDTKELYGEVIGKRPVVICRD